MISANQDLHFQSLYALTNGETELYAETVVESQLPLNFDRGSYNRRISHFPLTRHDI